MLDINVTEPYQKLLQVSQIYVLKSNPILKHPSIKYNGPDFYIIKKINKIQAHWSGKKLVTLQNVKSHKNKPKVPKQQIIIEEEKSSFNKKNLRRNKDENIN